MIIIQNDNNNNKNNNSNNNHNKTTNHRCYGMMLLERKFHLIQAHSIESYFKQQSQKVIIKWKIVVMCY